MSSKFERCIQNKELVEKGDWPNFIINFLLKIGSFVQYILINGLPPHPSQTTGRDPNAEQMTLVLLSSV